MPKKRIVLVVEDDPEISGTLKDLLVSEGFAVRIAANGADAINLLDDMEGPCVILVDLLMPGIVGQELLQYLRGEVRLAAIPVAVVSAVPALAPERYRVFRKPIALDALVRFVKEQCA